MVFEEAKKCVRILLSTCSEYELVAMLEDSELNDVAKSLIKEQLETVQERQV